MRVADRVKFKRTYIPLTRLQSVFEDDKCLGGGDVRCGGQSPMHRRGCEYPGLAETLFMPQRPVSDGVRFPAGSLDEMVCSVLNRIARRINGNRQVL